MEDGLAEAVDEGRVGPRDDPKTRGKILVSNTASRHTGSLPRLPFLRPSCVLWIRLGRALPSEACDSEICFEARARTAVCFYGYMDSARSIFS